MSDHGRMVVVVVGRGSSRFPIGSVRVAGTDHQVGGRVVDVGDAIVAQHQRRRHQRNTSFMPVATGPLPDDGLVFVWF